MNLISFSGSCQLNDKWSIRTGIGFIYDGKLKPNNQSAHNVKPGGVFTVGFEYLSHRGEGYIPYLDYSVFLSGSSTKTENPVNRNKTNYFSSDLRLGGRASWDINGNIFPYLTGRIFGGPVHWKINETDVTGTDIHHFQFAIGSAIQFGRIGTFVEWAGLGEKAFSFGMSYSF